MNGFTKKATIGLAASALLMFGSFGFTGSSASAKSNIHKKAWSATLPLKIKNNATSTYQNGYAPSQIRKAYGLDQLSKDGTGQTIAIVDAYGSPSLANDLNTFDSQFGLPAANLSIVYPNGKPRTTDGGWALETSLDVEWAHSIAPNAKIMVVVAKSSSLTNLLSGIDYATANGATVVSNSWGGSEFSGENSYDSHFSHSGIAYLASTGDNGSGVSWPSSSPSVLAVGGTTLNTDSSGNYISESAWSGSGGGKSSYESTPGFESPWTSVVGTQRGVPDIAFDADPNSGVAVYDSTPDSGQSGWFQVGGTSLSAPSWAAMVALADQGRSTPLSSSQALSGIYSIAGSTNSSGYTNNFHDVTSGSNGGYSAQAGYDLVTGIGSPKANVLLNALTNY